jgi:hypothetical protein
MGIELILIQIVLSLCLGGALLERTRRATGAAARHACADCGRPFERRELGEAVCRCERG